MRQQLNRVDHVTFIYRRDNFSSAMREFTSALGITDWDGPSELAAFGVLHAQSVEAGIELLAPLGDEGMFADHLRAHGEGFFALIFGVPDLDTAVKQAAVSGTHPVTGDDGRPLIFDAMVLLDGKPAYASWSRKFHLYREVLLQPVAGQNIYLGQIEPLTAPPRP